jgi:hypothetical protein
MFDAVSAVRVGNLDLIDSLGDLDDMAFLDLLVCMQESNQALCDRMRSIRELNARKRSLMDDIAGLEKAIRDSGADKDNDIVNIPPGLPGARHTEAVGDSQSDEELEGAAQEPGPGHEPQTDFKPNWVSAGVPNTRVGGDSSDGPPVEAQGGGTASVSGEGSSNAQDLIGLPTPVSKDKVDGMIEDLRAELEGLNNQSSVMMIDLQLMMNKRNEAVQFVSNVISKCHGTAMGIIANIK